MERGRPYPRWHSALATQHDGRARTEVIAYHCDREGCNTWQRIPAVSFLVVTGGHSERDSHLCSLDCLAHWAVAHSDPTEEYEW